MNNRNDLRYIIYADLYRNIGQFNMKRFLKICFTSLEKPSGKFIVTLRMCQYFLKKIEKKNNLLNKLIYKCLRAKLIKLQLKCGIEIEAECSIQEGLRIPHCGGIVVNSHCTIGRNCEILQGVTIGNDTFKDRSKAAKIGDNVFIGAGAKIIGGVTIGNNVTIGANAVVNKDIPDNAVAAGIPAKVVSNKKSIVINNDYKSRVEYFK